MNIINLNEFIQARIAEDEQAAHAAGGGLTHWTVHPASDAPDLEAQVRISGYYPLATMPADEARHVARHDPARVWREIKLKRTLAAEHTPVQDDLGIWICKPCSRWSGAGHEVFAYAPCGTLLGIAEIYAGHPDYREEWAP